MELEKVVLYPNPILHEAVYSFSNDYFGRINSVLLNIEGKIVKKFEGLKNSIEYKSTLDLGEIPLGFIF